MPFSGSHLSYILFIHLLSRPPPRPVWFRQQPEVFELRAILGGRSGTGAQVTELRVMFPWKLSVELLSINKRESRFHIQWTICPPEGSDDPFVGLGQCSLTFAVMVSSNDVRNLFTPGNSILGFIFMFTGVGIILLTEFCINKKWFSKKEPVQNPNSKLD